MTKPRTGQSGNWDRERADRLQKDVERMQKDVERLTAEREWSEDRFPCDGGCVDAPEETCSRHGRNPADLWRIIGEVAAERNALAAQVARLAEPGDPDARMDAYYYGFTRTGIGLVDNILSAVAKAGKSYHSTDMWGEELFGGGTCKSRIQDAADAAAEQIRDALSGSEADTSDTQSTDQEVSDE